MGLIFLLSSIEYPDRIGLPKGSDKVIHFFEYAVLSALLLLSFIKSGARKNVLLISVLIATLYGMSDEYHQLYVEGRYASVGDVIADFIGSVAGVFVLKMFFWR